ncbi:Peptidyl-prolyl cis-trans isomerase-like 1 [Auxenochlorella protothecoides]|uniref:Peptidyl-prolyl cis-trans isomerase n=1 Tax=Auxenochlorella protothecoides TaxID=3075 RepID=A0A087SJA2_AUXPR|nr:Peptidyl-prolyl cis-trans isomerase-like 1 [Auxenochlorella protothecoides]KFM25806.1 Peptidyl-prolyl cis-trans isomerase-like 1 [Auxenochlorella protothecoides]
MAAPMVEIQTSMGSFTVELYERQAPRTVQNFIGLAIKGYYDGTVVSGDPTGTGRGGTSVFGGKFEDEVTRELKHTGAGILSMANSGPNTNGSQFFITLAPTPHLDGKHTIFGRVSSGMEVIKRLGNVQTDAGDRPLGEVRIIKARLL